jgi:hypothetical protein
MSYSLTGKPEVFDLFNEISNFDDFQVTSTVQLIAGDEEGAIETQVSPKNFFSIHTITINKAT